MILSYVNIKKFSPVLGIATLLTASSCAVDTTVDTQFYYNDNKDLLINHSVSLVMDDQLLELYQQTEGEISLEDFCEQTFDEFISGINTEPTEITHRDKQETFECSAHFNNLSVSDFNEGDLYGLYVAESEEGEILLELDDENENNWVSQIHEASEGDFSGFSVEFIVEFPGEIQEYSAGKLIAERSYDNSVDRSSIRNIDVESSNIIHITDNEIIENDGFYVIADNGDTINWVNVALYAGIALLSLGFLFLIFAFFRRQSAIKKRRAPAKLALADPHVITLDNPNPYDSKKYNDSAKPKRTRKGGLSAASPSSSSRTIKRADEDSKETVENSNDNENDFYQDSDRENNEDQKEAEDLALNDIDKETKPGDSSKDSYSYEENQYEMPSDMFLNDNKKDD